MMRRKNLLRRTIGSSYITIARSRVDGEGIEALFEACCGFRVDKACGLGPRQDQTITEALMKTDAVTKVKTSKPNTPPEPFAVGPKLGAPNFNLPNVEVPVVLRDWAEKGLEQARSNYEIIKTNAEQAAVALENAYAAALKGAADYGLKALDVARVNTNAAFDFARDLISAKSPSELIELSTGHARKQFETLSAQSRELAELTQKVASDAATPVRDAVSKTLKKAS